jgi:hypothetical protein
MNYDAWLTSARDFEKYHGLDQEEKQDPPEPDDWTEERERRNKKWQTN